MAAWLAVRKNTEAARPEERSRVLSRSVEGRHLLSIQFVVHRNLQFFRSRAQKAMYISTHNANYFDKSKDHIGQLASAIAAWRVYLSSSSLPSSRGLEEEIEYI